MFVLEGAVPAYRDPWEEPLIARLGQLRSRRVRVAYLYEVADGSTFRYRAFNMQQHINALDGDVSASYFFASELNAVVAELPGLTAIVVCRYRYDHRLADLVALARVHGVTVLFDIDDYVFDPALAHLVLSTLGQSADEPAHWDYWFSYIARLEAALRLTDGAIATNRYLADRIAARTMKPAVVIPNFLNPAQEEVSAGLFLEKAGSSFARDGYFDIGYFSGSPTHQQDFEIAKPALLQLLADDPKTRLVTVGYLDTSDLRHQFPRQVSHRRMTDFLGLQHLVASVEVNIVPLQDNVFTNAKSELKYFEAAVVGTLTVATGTFAYANAIVPGRNGFIAGNGEWYDSISHIRSNMADYPKWAEAARGDALAAYTGGTITTAITAMFERFGIV